MVEKSAAAMDSADEGAALARSRRLVEALRDPRRAPLGAASVDLIETHVSFILLAGARAYKLKKPIRLAFLDFTRLETRRRACEDELRLNRRTAPELYLRVVAIRGTLEEPRLSSIEENEASCAAEGGPLEWAVEMRRFDPEALLARRVAEGRVDRECIDRFADGVARFHGEVAGSANSVAPGEHGTPITSAMPAPPPAPTALATPASPISPAPGTAIARRNLAELGRLPLPCRARERFDAIAAWLEVECRALEGFLAERRRAGFVRELHGDLHLANVALVDGRPVLFDCLEFDVELRTLDVIDEIAFAFMDFLALGRADLGWRFVNRYLEQAGDYAGAVALRFFAVHRALVRAKIAAIRSDGDEVERYVDVAGTQVAAPRARLILTHGLAGSGKTTVSSVLVERLGAIRLRSDVERKRRAGLAAADRSASPIGGGLYDAGGSQQTYAQLAHAARSLLEAGQTVIVDAAFLARAERARFAQLARAAGLEFWIVDCTAPVEILRARIEARTAIGRDASEADAAVLDHQLAHAEPFEASELERVVVVATDAGPSALEAAIQRMGGDEGRA